MGPLGTTLSRLRISRAVGELLHHVQHSDQLGISERPKALADQGPRERMSAPEHHMGEVGGNQPDHAWILIVGATFRKAVTDQAMRQEGRAALGKSQSTSEVAHEQAIWKQMGQGLKLMERDRAQLVLQPCRQRGGGLAQQGGTDSDEAVDEDLPPNWVCRNVHVYVSSS
ncbi:MAG: hypothetical protein JWO59_1617 [Chloroflexi bacterium]|nr:hypothetical protein [Chloroflexota bacterium]MDB5058145.1 hypothetical protein [Chloroflexota bacterium]